MMLSSTYQAALKSQQFSPESSDRWIPDKYRNRSASLINKFDQEVQHSTDTILDYDRILLLLLPLAYNTVYGIGEATTVLLHAV